jgi:hypothetical protein
MAEDDIPLLRADATDDQDEGTEPFEDDPEVKPEIRIPARAIPDSEDEPAGEDGTVDPASPGATSANGVIHGGR